MNDLTTKDSQSLFSPSNFEHAQRVASMMSKSAMVPKGYIGKPADILIAMEYGRALNLGPLQAIQNIAVINGKPSIYGDGILAVCSGHPEFENIDEEPILDSSNNTIGYCCSVQRKGRAAVIQQFTIDDAKRASLWGKAGPWSQYPNRMLQMRARAFALRDAFADALGGVRVVEETQDYTTKDITPKAERKAKAKEELAELINKNKQDVNDEDGQEESN